MTQIIAIFEIENMTVNQYESVEEELLSLGLSNPKGRIQHVAAPMQNGWYVTDIWESADHLDRFAKTLVPILIKNNVKPASPTVYKIHNKVDHN